MTVITIVAESAGLFKKKKKKMSFQIYETIGSIMKYDVIDENSSNLPKKKKVVIKFNYLTQSQIITLKKNTHTHTHAHK